MTRLRKSMFFLGGAFLLALYGYVRFFHVSTPYPLLSCERHELSYDGQALIGIEDMAYDLTAGRVYFSAYNRRTNREGGVYYFSPSSPENINKLALPRPLWPHGIELTRDGQTLSLTLIDRSFIKPKQAAARLRQFNWTDETQIITETPLPIDAQATCNANNLTSVNRDQGSSYILSQDREACAYNKRKWENLTRPNGGQIITLTPNDSAPVEISLSGLYFPNGISRQDERIYIAETRKKRLSIYTLLEGGALDFSTHIALSGGPDNLTSDGTGIWAALHPDLLRFALYRARWLSRAPSRIAHYAKDGRVNHYDISPDIISGATVALKAGKSILLGGAFDKALAICSYPKGETARGDNE